LPEPPAPPPLFSSRITPTSQSPGIVARTVVRRSGPGHPAGVEGLDDISMLPNLSVELVRRGYSSRDLEKFWGGNLLRVLREVENAAGR